LWQDIRESADGGTGVLVTTHSMDEAEQCDRLAVMVGGRVAVEGTVSDVIGNRQVAQVKCDDWRKAFTVLDAAGLIVQVQGEMLRVPGSPDHVEELLAQHKLDGTVQTVPANLEEVFVSIVLGTSRQ
jgi:ABC-type multidrug transport system ATPase subunit